MRRTKIICTLGPAVDSEEAMKKLILSGMNGARFNFSHGTHESQLATLERLNRARAELGIPVAAILDTKGPEIRVRNFENGKVTLTEGAEFTLTGEDCLGTAERASVTYPHLAEELDAGGRILLDDGLIELRVERCQGPEVHCRVITGGVLSNHKSINIPDGHISLPAVTEQDERDLAFAAEHGFDWVAASFIRSAADLEEIRAVLRRHGGEGIRLMAKIENREGIEHLDEILDSADAVMVARGDLGVEIPAAEVPVHQKRMVAGAVRRGKVVVIATQMLDSMIRNPRPTRAEVSDVANAIFEGASCVMLSGETASGAYPFEALRTMVEAVEAAENSLVPWERFRGLHDFGHDSINEAITHACCTTAMDLSAEAILTMTRSGHTARMVARFRPGCPIVALTPDERVARQLAIVWGVLPAVAGDAASTDEVFARSVEKAKELGVLRAGDTAVITAGVPLGRVGSTNLIHAVEV
ncbi:MAG: pyruvate kinase [Oscillospiraceae bacterium]|nr:pyruvate kinase [Oscillospiraceae bacterium]